MSQVSGQADNRNSFGVVGTATTDLTSTSAGVTGVSGTPDSVQSWSDRVDALGQLARAAVSGVTPNLQGTTINVTSYGFLAGDDPYFHQHAGVYGESDAQGVNGLGTTDASTGVFGATKSGGGIGVRGETSTGVGVKGRSFGPGLAGHFQGNVRMEGNVEVTGTLLVDVDITLKSRDLAERFEAAQQHAPGNVMVLAAEGRVKPCARAYDKRAVGVISGAGTLKPAITLGEESDSVPSVPIAMVGTAYCMVDADPAPIEIGDLLTSSDTCGHAMKATDPAKSFGAVIGKALAPLDCGKGLIPIVVALQ